MIRNFVALVLLLPFSVVASPTQREDVVYGIDNRKDTFEVESELFLHLARSTAAMIPKERVVLKGQTIELLGRPLSEMIPPEVSFPVCEKERFSAQPTASVCSGFLVAEDVLVTAGHCVLSANVCEEYVWVFNYKVGSAEDRAVSVAPEDVVGCSQVIARGLSFGIDFGLVRLERPLKGLALKLAQKDPDVGTPLVMIGHPSGLPQKITDGARVSSLLLNGFHADLDAFRGNSGSAVFNAETGELLGILVNGKTDYVDNPELSCSEVNVIDGPGGEGVSSFRQFASVLTQNSLTEP